MDFLPQNTDTSVGKNQLRRQVVGGGSNCIVIYTAQTITGKKMGMKKRCRKQIGMRLCAHVAGNR